LGATVFFVLLNGFFVAAEFALVKVRGTRLQWLADRGNSRARVTLHMLGRLDLYLSACQFGITVSSLILGWLAEPAVARLLVALATALGWPVGESTALHAVALVVALTVITTLHMTLGEQAPKIWAIQRSEVTALQIAYPLRIFTFVFVPLIWVINRISNWMLKLAGISLTEQHEASYSVDELGAILLTSAQAGHISNRQRQFADNILGFVNLQVRHILVPRVDVVWLSIDDPVADNLRTIRESGHSRFPLCEDDLDRAIGIVHTKDIMGALSEGRPVNLGEIARKPVYIPDTQPLARMVVELQRERAKSAIVVDDHGTAIGMAFLEDALEEIVGPIQDEFDDEEESVSSPDSDVVEMRGEVPFPEALDLLDLDEIGADDTIGGHVVSLLRRLPKEGDQLTMGPYRVTVTKVTRRRVLQLRFEGIKDETENPPT
jgi:CBS domain containing-hemolysin-like protein